MSLAPEIERLVSVSYHTTGSSGEGVTAEETERGTWIVKGLKVFKSGTFKDSMGVQRTWGAEHLQQMVFHFHLLKDRDILPNVPVRADHWSGVDGLIGYFTNLVADEAFLYGDIEITEPPAYEKWARGTYRSRSLEVGFYETNDEAVYWPVVVGLAFVDMPAVEGLHSRAGQKETTKVTTGAEGQTQNGAGAAAAGGAGGGTADAAGQQGTTEAAAAGTSGAGAAAAGAGTSAPVTHAAGNVHTFMVNGQSVSDFGAVQRHITALEAFQKETLESGRTDFVKALAHAKKIEAKDEVLSATTEFALSLTADQYDKWKKSWGDVPEVSLLAQHGAGAAVNADGTQEQSGQESATDAAVEIAAETIQSHMRAGMPNAKIKETGSYKKLLAAKPDHPALADIF